MPLPNFIVIGAAKAGTTALYWYLAEHPAVFMSPVKETNYFAYGVDGAGRLLYGDPDMHPYPITSQAQYEALFAEAGGATAVGEASPIYLEAPQTAGRIRAAIPDVRLICGLRQPVSRAYSDYLMYLRSHGRRFDAARDLSPTADWARPDSHWMRIGRYGEMLARYYAEFPRQRIHVFLFDDLTRGPLAVTQEIYRFLGVDPGFQPDLETPHNVGGLPANRMLEGMLTSGSLRAMARPWLPRQAVNWVRRLRTRNLRQAPALPSELRQSLTRNFHDDILRTSELIGRDLTQWL